MEAKCTCDVKYVIAVTFFSERGSASKRQGCSAVAMGTIGQARAALPFAKDPEYHFDVYRVIRNEEGAVDRER